MKFIVVSRTHVGWVGVSYSSAEMPLAYCTAPTDEADAIQIILIETLVYYNPDKKQNKTKKKKQQQTNKQKIKRNISKKQTKKNKQKTVQKQTKTKTKNRRETFKFKYIKSQYE